MIPVSEGRIGLEVKGNVLRNRQDRIKHLEEQLGRESKTVYETKLDDLLRLRKGAKTKVEAADLVFVTSGEIDEQGELGNVSTARRFMDDVLSTLPRAVKTLAGLGCDTVVIAADHGYLFGDELSSDTKIDPPGGDTKDLHRRVWVGVGGADEPSFLRVPLSRMGPDAEDLDVAVPWGFGAFKSPGGSAAYFHGGMSPQEMTIPVLSLKLKATTDDDTDSGIDWELSLNSKKISTRFVSVRVGGRPAGRLAFTLPRVRAEVRVGGKVVSEPVSATYDFSDTALDVGLRLAGGEIEANTVTLMIDSDAHPEARSGTASVHLLDATTGVGLTSTDGVEIDISV